MEGDRRGAASIAIGEDHVALAGAVRRFATEQCPPTLVRAFIDNANGNDNANANANGTVDNDTGDGRPPLATALADLGWLGLPLAEDRGGQGAGLAEAAIVVEELAKAVAPGPTLPTMWAIALLARSRLLGSAADSAHPELDFLALDPAEQLATGAISGAVVLDAALHGDRRPDGSVAVTGLTGPVLGGDVAGVVIIPVEVDGGETWWIAGPDSFEVTNLPPLDPTRSIADLRFDASPLDAGAQLDGLDLALVEAVTGALAAAECAGLASWCVDTAARHATDRRQFGRPIGQFQAVKHRCADMLAAAESIRALAWDAANALDEVGRSEDPDRPTEPGEATTARQTGAACTPAEAAMVASSAVAIALDAAVQIAEDCIQVLGGIGFTWEHDAHLYLRRAVALRQLLGGGGRARRAVATAAIAGTRRRLRVELPPEAEPLRAEIRALVDQVAALPKDERRPLLAELGLLVPHWPTPWGRDAGAVEQLLIDDELRRAKVRLPHLQVGAWAAPTIVAHGTVEQQERWVRPTLLGEVQWCQLFSEPEAGSDLAALRTTGTKVDGGWQIDGQKVWTTMAKEADWGICLIRTNPTAPKHLGITYVIVDMRSDGIDIRPLKEMTGLEMFNEVFFDGLFVPDDCVIGEVDGGWPLARTTLGNERVAMGSGSSFGGGIEALLLLVAALHGREELDLDDPVLLDRLGALVAESHVVSVLGARATHRSVSGAKPGPEASIRKLIGAEHDQRAQEFGLSLLGPWGATAHGDAAQWTFGFLANRCLTIAGGTSEIQRNVIGERLLGLPRDPEPT